MWMTIWFVILNTGKTNNEVYGTNVFRLGVCCTMCSPSSRCCYLPHVRKFDFSQSFTYTVCPSHWINYIPFDCLAVADLSRNSKIHYLADSRVVFSDIRFRFYLHKYMQGTVWHYPSCIWANHPEHDTRETWPPCEYGSFQFSVSFTNRENKWQTLLLTSIASLILFLMSWIFCFFSLKNSYN